MAIEIKQLMIKSSVADDSAANEEGSGGGDCCAPSPKSAANALKDDMMKECRRMILDILNDKGLR
jgi:hypothetical protein